MFPPCTSGRRYSKKSTANEEHILFTFSYTGESAGNLSLMNSVNIKELSLPVIIKVNN